MTSIKGVYQSNIIITTLVEFHNIILTFSFIFYIMIWTLEDCDVGGPYLVTSCCMFFITLCN